MAKKEQTLEEIMASLAKRLGVDLDLDTVQEARREADSLILYFQAPDKFREARCQECRCLFATNYSAVASCSDKCRIQYLSKRGIDWNLLKPAEERWDGRIPLVIGSAALALAKLALMQER